LPGRNALFLTAAASHAYTKGMGSGGALDLVGGMCQTDYAGYPDCRLDFVEAQQRALALALDAEVRIHTPLVHLTKAETWKLAADLGTVGGGDVLATVRDHRHTDYNGDSSERPACGLGHLDQPAYI